MLWMLVQPEAGDDQRFEISESNCDFESFLDHHLGVLLWPAAAGAASDSWNGAGVLASRVPGPAATSGSGSGVLALLDSRGPLPLLAGRPWGVGVLRAGPAKVLSVAAAAAAAV